VELEGSLLWLQENMTGPHPDPGESMVTCWAISHAMAIINISVSGTFSIFIFKVVVRVIWAIVSLWLAPLTNPVVVVMIPVLSLN
jgi:hypothetical protein